MAKKRPEKPKWSRGQITRRDAFSYGLVEDICAHGVGHPNVDWLKGKAAHWGVHGCDGCCAKPEKP